MNDTLFFKICIDSTLIVMIRIDSDTLLLNLQATTCSVSYSFRPKLDQSGQQAQKQFCRRSLYNIDNEHIAMKLSKLFTFSSVNFGCNVKFFRHFCQSRSARFELPRQAAKSSPSKKIRAAFPFEMIVSLDLEDLWSQMGTAQVWNKMNG